MLDKNNIRQLAYVVAIDEIQPIKDYDRVEYARVGGWWVIVKKNQFKVGDLAIYIEVDAKVPAEEPFMFLESKKFKVKTQKMCKVISQGLLMHPHDFPNWDVCGKKMDGETEWTNYIEDEKGNSLYVGDFVTEKLKITYADAEDNRRKAPSADKYKKMAQRNPKIFKTKIARWMMNREWGKKFMFLLFGKKKDKKGGWPAWVSKTDEERCQNMPWLFTSNSDEEWIASEKIDGTSTTFTMRGFGRKREFYVCSRNVVFDKPEQKCYYESNVYLEMAEKYDIENKMASILDARKDELEFVTIQGETYGESIQKRSYGLKEHKLMVFNLIFGFKNGETKRFNPIEMTKFLEEYYIPCVPIIDEHFKLPKTCDELLQLAGGASKIDGEMREGLVFRSLDGARSFKAVDNQFLLKYHS